MNFGRCSAARQVAQNTRSSVAGEIQDASSGFLTPWSSEAQNRVISDLSRSPQGTAMSTDGRQISIVIEFTVPEENRKLFLERLLENCKDTLNDDGCFRMEVSEPIDGASGTCILTERWRDQAAIDAHRKKPGHDAQHERLDALVTTKRVAKCFVIAG
jgi:quinol monooxygenase YgiN